MLKVKAWRACCLTPGCRALLPSPSVSMSENSGEVESEVRERLRAARSVFVLTGAGVSAESGVPTFRGGGGTAVWKGMPFDVISSAGFGGCDLPAGWEGVGYRRG